MWVSREGWERILQRLEELETFKREAGYERAFTVYPNGPVPADPWPENAHLLHWTTTPCFGPSQQISVKDVLEAVLKQIGMKLRFDSGQPARVKIEITEKK